MTMSMPKNYTVAQRMVALIYGLGCHITFGAAVACMALSLFTGLRFSQGPFEGLTARFANAVLLLSFPLIHSFLLGRRGRRLCARLTPLGLGGDLYWTQFVWFASAQLFLVFVLWSPSEVIWWQATGPLRIAVGVAALAAWVLLGKSMSDAQLGVQTGFIAWSSIVRNQKAHYKSFATEGLYRHVRQPIYISFALLLWLTSVWTPDQLVLALGWTTYCVVGSAIKEKRFFRCFGAPFNAYRRAVPFWIPFLKPRGIIPSHDTKKTCNTEVAIVGGGPVGLMLANLLGKVGVNVLVMEQRSTPLEGSLAIGITPPSLKILESLSMDQAFIEEGIKISTAKAFEKGKLLGEVNFSALPNRHTFILSVPQSITVHLLEKSLQRYPSVTHLKGVEFVDYTDQGDAVEVVVKDQKSGSQTTLSSRWLVGCDGNRSRVRARAKIPFPRKKYRDRFFMADFEDRTDLQQLACLYFGPKGSVESFPLPNHQRRWIIQAPHKKTPTTDIGTVVQTYVKKRTGMDLSLQEPQFKSWFQPQRGLAKQYSTGHILLCGDAAHVMSPIGGQGMNTGFSDAAHLAAALIELLHNPSATTEQLLEYHKVRRKAFKKAASRAACGMWLGTRKGPMASVIRGLLVRKVLFRDSIRKRLSILFAMLTLPLRMPETDPIQPKVEASS